MNSINEIKKFMKEYGFRDGIEEQVVVYVDGEKFDASVQFAYNVGYMQYAVNIIWEFGDSTMRKKGLYGMYNTNFQKFTYENGTLSFDSNGHDIVIRK